jgi:gas vesicle protein
MNKTSRTIFAFLLGAATGALIGILYAPDKGSNTREKLSFLLQKYRKQLEDLIEELVNTKNIPSSQAKTEGERVIKDAREKAEKLLQDVDSLIGQIKNKKA